MPKQSSAQILGRKGERWFESILPSQWVLQRPAEDFGVDAMVLIGDSKKIAQLEFGVQIKSSRNFKNVDGFLVLPRIPIDTARYWAHRFVPTLLVAYDDSTDTGFYAWLADAVSIQDLNSSKKSVSARIPRRNVLLQTSWATIERRVIYFHNRFLDAMTKQQEKEKFIEYLSDLTSHLSALCLAAAIPSDNEEARMTKHLLAATGNGETVRTLRAMIDFFDNDDLLRQFLVPFTTEYYELCKSVFDPFDRLVLCETPVVAYTINEQMGATILPKLTFNLSMLVKNLTRLL